jgi:hypothetical protein
MSLVSGFLGGIFGGLSSLINPTPNVKPADVQLSQKWKNELQDQQKDLTQNLGEKEGAKLGEKIAQDLDKKTDAKKNDSNTSDKKDVDEKKPPEDLKKKPPEDSQSESEKKKEKKKSDKKKTTGLCPEGQDPYLDMYSNASLKCVKSGTCPDGFGSHTGSDGKFICHSPGRPDPSCPGDFPYKSAFMMPGFANAGSYCGKDSTGYTKVLDSIITKVQNFPEENTPNQSPESQKNDSKGENEKSPEQQKKSQSDKANQKGKEEGEKLGEKTGSNLEVERLRQIDKPLPPAPVEFDLAMAGAGAVKGAISGVNNLFRPNIVSKVPKTIPSASDSIRPTWKTSSNSFKSESLEMTHFKDHGKDFGASSPKEYTQKAINFRDKFKDSGFDLPNKFDPRNGDLRVYDPKTNTFASYRPDGSPKTFYKPDPSQHQYESNATYWWKQPGNSTNGSSIIKPRNDLKLPDFPE